MPTIREKYFALLGLNHKHLTKSVIYDLLILANNLSSQTDLFLRFDDECQNVDLLEENTKRILRGFPLQYILKKANFLGYEFFVDRRVLIPRQETQELVSLASTIIKEKFGDKKVVIGDICTGSGCIGITLKNLIENSEVYLTDISEAALEVAHINNKKFGQKVKVLQGNLLEPIQKEGVLLDVIISNPPYIPGPETVSEQTLKYEPHLALFASPSYRFYKEIFEGAKLTLKDTGLLFFEIGEDMEEVLSPIAREYFPGREIKFLKDMYNKIRFLFII